MSFAWTKKQHINVLELSMVRVSLLWLMRRGFRDVKCVLLSDSQVTIAICSRFRSSSLRMQRQLRKIAALVLASGISPTFVWVKSKDNPSDDPSRRWVSVRKAGELKRLRIRN